MAGRFFGFEKWSKNSVDGWLTDDEFCDVFANEIKAHSHISNPHTGVRLTIHNSSLNLDKYTPLLKIYTCAHACLQRQHVVILYNIRGNVNAM